MLRLVSILLHVLLLSTPATALTQYEIDNLLDGNILVGNRASGGRVQIFPTSLQEWTEENVIWEYDTRKNVDGLTMSFNKINDVKRIRLMNTEFILMAGNGPGLALFNLHTEKFVFSYKPEVPAGTRCSRKELSIHAAEMLPDGNFAVADPTGSDRGGAAVRLIYGSNSSPRILQSLRFPGVHAVVWDYKRQRLWAFGGSRLSKYSYVSAGLDSALIQDGLQYRSPEWISAGHDMMPYGEDGLIFTCAEGVGVFHIEEERFELLYGNNDMATNHLLDVKIQRGKGVDHNSNTGEIIHNLYESSKVRSPTNMATNETMTEWSYEPSRDMAMYKAHWFVHNEFSYGPADASHIPNFPINRASTNRRPQWSSTHRRNAIVTAGEFYKRNIRKHSTDPDGDSPIYEKICGPKWLSITRAGMISGTPDHDNVDDDYRPMLIRVSDKGGLSDVAEYEFRVNAAPTSSPTQHPTTTLYAKRMEDSDTLIYYGPEEVGPGQWKTSGIGPFGRCSGDCDNNDDCVRGLVCFQRDGVENNVPGCLGEAVQDVDYCVLPSQNFDVLTYIGDTGPFGTCGGDCDHDDDCMPGLVCFQRDGEDNNVPGCDGTATDNVDYCIVDPSTVTGAPTTWDMLYGLLDPPSSNEVDGGEVATVPSTTLTTDPSKLPTRKPSSFPVPSPPTPSPSAQATDTPLPFAPTGSVWEAFMDMVNKYGEAKKRASFEPTSEDAPLPSSSPQPTTEFHAAWTHSLARWQNSNQEKPTPAPTTEIHALLASKMERWKSTGVHHGKTDEGSDSP